MLRTMAKGYSLEWCEAVVKAHDESHARVVQIFYHSYGIGPKWAAKLIILEGNYWRRWKAIIKKAESLLLHGRTTTQTLSTLDMVVQILLSETGCEPLTGPKTGI